MKSGFQYDGLTINKIADKKYSLKLSDHFTGIKHFYFRCIFSSH